METELPRSETEVEGSVVSHRRSRQLIVGVITIGLSLMIYFVMSMLMPAQVPRAAFLPAPGPSKAEDCLPDFMAKWNESDESEPCRAWANYRCAGVALDAPSAPSGLFVIWRPVDGFWQRRQGRRVQTFFC